MDISGGIKDITLLPFDGKLWQKSGYDHSIRNQQDYNKIWQYIANNPVKWVMIYKYRERHIRSFPTFMPPRPACF